MKILVTGGTGVVGAAAIPALLAAGHEIRLLSRHADRDVANFPSGVEPFQADISDPAQLAGAVHGCECVLHIAGIVEEEPPEITFDRINVQGTRHLVNASEEAGLPTLIYLSSLGADRGESEYHRSKLRAEEIVRDYSGRWVILRPGNVYGPGDETLSMLLKLVRTLPAVPMVANGEQPFQPLWYLDFGRAVTQIVADLDRFEGRTLELAGTDVTTTEQVLERLATITGRSPQRVPVPAWLAEVGAQALEAFGSAGQKLLRRAGLATPLNSAKLMMLLEGSVLPDPLQNALLTELDVEPTSLDDGLAMLADLLPEQLPGEGVGAITQATYSAEIQGSPFSAAELMDRVCDNVTDVMPIEFAAEPGVPTKANEEGATLTAGIKGRGHVQVRLEERTESRATFITLESHPLAGVMQFHAEELPGGGVRFNVHTASQPANVFDWVAMKVAGDAMQQENWRAVVRRVVELSGGTSPTGVRRRSHTMDTTEVGDLRIWSDRLVQRQQRAQRAEQVS
jgi:NADH dehydrogenase